MAPAKERSSCPKLVMGAAETGASLHVGGMGGSTHTPGKDGRCCCTQQAH